MLTMSEINMRLKENFQRQLQDMSDLPEDLGKGYKEWVRGLVVQASKKIQEEVASSEGQAEQGGVQEATA